jgi:hypothetical protein
MRLSSSSNLSSLASEPRTRARSLSRSEMDWVEVLKNENETRQTRRRLTYTKQESSL